MEQAALDDVTLAYEVSGTGESVLFIHGSFIADAFRPLLTEPVLADRYRLITYHRTHFLQMQNSGGMADALASFLARHPL